MTTLPSPEFRIYGEGREDGDFACTAAELDRAMGLYAAVTVAGMRAMAMDRMDGAVDLSGYTDRSALLVILADLDREIELGAVVAADPLATLLDAPTGLAGS